LDLAEYERAVSKSWQAVVAAYAKAIQAHTAAKRLEEAEAVQKELNAFLLANDQRFYWVHATGSFQQQQDKKWLEKHRTAAYQFDEAARTVEYVELYDAGRECRVRLYADGCRIKFADGDWHPLYTGAWAPPPGADK